MRRRFNSPSAFKAAMQSIPVIALRIPDRSRQASAGHVERLGGVGEIVAGQLQELTGKETRTVVLGHLLRGGQPTSLDRSLGLIFGAAAVRALVEGHDGVMVAVNPPRLDYVPLRVATAKLKLVAADDYGMMTARTLDVSFGDLSANELRLFCATRPPVVRAVQVPACLACSFWAIPNECIREWNAPSACLRTPRHLKVKHEHDIVAKQGM